MMKWGWAIWNMKDCSQADKCRRAVKLGLDFISFNTSPLTWAERNPDGEAATAELLKELNLGWTVHTGLSPDDDPEAKLNELRVIFGKINRFAESAGAPLVVSFDAAFRGVKPNKTYDHDSTSNGLKLAFEELGSLGTKLAVENIRDTSRPETLSKLGDQVPGLGMLLDTGHMNFHLHGDGDKVADYIASLPLPIVDMHLHSNDGEHDQHTPLDKGCLPLKELGQAMQAQDYSGLATLEILRPEMTGLQGDSPEDMETLRNSLGLAREHLEG